MTTIAQLRDSDPDLAGLDDNQVVDVVHQAYYADLPREQVAKALGVTPPAPPPPERTFWGTVGDAGISAAKGIIAVPEAAVGIADLATGGRAGKFLENEDGMIGFRPKQAKAMLDEGLSDAQKAANEQVQRAEGLWETVKAAVKNPSVAGMSVLESIPLMLGGGLVGRGVAAAGRGAIGAGMAAGVGEGTMMAGSAAESIRQQTADGLLTGEQAGLAGATGAAGTLFGVLGARIAKSLGIADVDALIVGAATNPRAGKHIVRKVLEGAVAEGFLEELPQSVSERVLENMALGRPLDDGVNQAAVLGTMAGGLMGGGAQFLSGGRKPAAAPAPAPSGPAFEPAPDGWQRRRPTPADVLAAPDVDTAIQTAMAAAGAPAGMIGPSLTGNDPGMLGGMTGGGRPNEALLAAARKRTVQPEDPFSGPPIIPATGATREANPDLAGGASSAQPAPGAQPPVRQSMVGPAPIGPAPADGQPTGAASAGQPVPGLVPDGRPVGTSAAPAASVPTAGAGGAAGTAAGAQPEAQRPAAPADEQRGMGAADAGAGARQDGDAGEVSDGGRADAGQLTPQQLALKLARAAAAVGEFEAKSKAKPDDDGLRLAAADARELEQAVRFQMQKARENDAAAWESYDREQEAVAALDKGDRVQTPEGPGTILRKFARNWHVDIDGVGRRTLPPGALIPITIKETSDAAGADGRDDSARGAQPQGAQPADEAQAGAPAAPAASPAPAASAGEQAGAAVDAQPAEAAAAAAPAPADASAAPASAPSAGEPREDGAAGEDAVRAGGEPAAGVGTDRWWTALGHVGRHQLMEKAGVPPRVLADERDGGGVVAMSAWDELPEDVRSKLVAAAKGEPPPVSGPIQRSAGIEPGKAAPLYAQRKVLNADAILAWAKSEGITSLESADKLHVTIAFSRADVDPGKVGNTSPAYDKGRITGTAGRKVEYLGDEGALVLKFDSPVLQARWGQYRRAGASWDFEGYQPHITIAYHGTRENLLRVKPYTGPIELGPELQEPLDLEPKAETGPQATPESSAGAASEPKNESQQAAPETASDQPRDPESGQFVKAEEAAAPAAEPEQKGSPSALLADDIDQWLSTKGEPLSWQALFKMADARFGGTQAEGKYTPKDAYDALEMGVNRHIVGRAGLYDPRVNEQRARAVLGRLEKLLELVPTQSKRTVEQDAFQQFSTPPTVGYIANWVANIDSQGTPDTMMEPSAGIGGLAVFAKNAGAALVLNELSDRRAALLRELFPGTKVYTENAEQLHNILPDSVRPTVVVMNPPFSNSAARGVKKDTMIGAQHVEQALLRLADGGRLVAIVGEGMARDKPTFRAWWKKIDAQYTVRAAVPMDGAGYAKYGTTFDNVLLVIDKAAPADGQKPPVTQKVAKYEELIPLLQEVRDERPRIELDPAERAPAGTVPEGEGDAGAGAAGGGAGVVGQGSPAGSQPAVAGGGGRGSRGGRAGRPTGDVRQPGDAATDASDQHGRGSARDGEAAGGPQSGLTVAAEDAAAGDLTDSVFESYRPQRLKVDGARAHPGPLVQSAAMATVLPPKPAYTPNLPRETIEGGLLSLAQIEAVVYAGQAHSELLETAGDSEKPPRRGFFIGDGTGVGKGREIGGIMLDNIRQGRKRHVWVSEKQGLMRDAQRDFEGVGGDKSLIFNQNKTKAEEDIPSGDGILFTTYATLRSGAQSQNVGGKTLTMAQLKRLYPENTPLESKNGHKLYLKGWGSKFVTVSHSPNGYRQWKIPFATLKMVDGREDWNDSKHLAEPSANAKSAGQSRLDQLVKWLGDDFDGVIAFDESHNAGNATPMKSERGTSEPSAQALAVVELQKRLPNARVIYVSATGATQVSNLSYATRLGLWGPGTPFPSVQSFISEMTAGGLATMELVARDMKQMGAYIARSLSYDGVTYSRVEHQLTPIQQDIYNRLAEAWQVTLQNFDKALEITEGDKSGKAKSAARSAYWGAQQRFFNQIITSMQMPSVIDQMEADLAAGDAIVAQLVNTNEAQQNRAMARRKEEGEEDLEDLDLTPRDQLMQMVEKSFPVVQYTEVFEDDGSRKVIPVMDSDGNPVLNKQAVALRDQLLKDLVNIKVPDGPLEILLNHFGPDRVAEVTGRTQRVVRKPDAEGNVRAQLETRGPSAAAADADAFQADKKPILVFSDAGGTGFSFHADLTKKNQRKRKHYLLQPGWRADKAVQGFGRSHRSNQKTEPHYFLASTNIPAQKRFLSAIARRLDQLGALTKGQRDTANQGMFDEKDNLEGKYATQAVRQFIDDLRRGKLSGIDFNEFLLQTGLQDIVDENTRQIPEEKYPSTQTFLNRMLSLKLDMQDKVFAAFISIMEEKVDVAIQRGELDTGMQTIKALSARVKNEEVVYTDPKSGAQTTYVELELSHPTRFFKFPTEAGERRKVEYFVNDKSGRVWARVPSGEQTLKNGAVVARYAMRGTTGTRFVTEVDFRGDKGKSLRKVEEAEARSLWEQENAAKPETYTDEAHMIVGAMLPIWDRMKTGGTMRVARTQTVDGRRLLGRLIDAKDIADVKKRLNVTSTASRMSPAEVQTAILRGMKGELSNGWTLERAKVSGDNRIELKAGYLSGAAARELVGYGIITERINWQDRYFVPVGEKGEGVLAAMFKHKPLVEITDPRTEKAADPTAQEPDEPAFSQAAPSEPTPQQRVRVGRLQAVADAITRAWQRAPQTVVVASFESPSVPAEVRAEGRRRMSEGGGRPKGVFYGGRVYLFADGIVDDRDAATVIFHEVRGHFGLHGRFGSELDAVLDRVITLRRADVDAMIERTKMKRDDPRTPYKAAEEVLAYMAQTNPMLGLVRSAIAAIRTWLRDTFPGLFGKMELSDDEIIRSFLIPAREWVDGPPSPGGGMEPQTSMAFADVAPPFYSALQRAMEAVPAKALPVAGWTGAIQAQINKGSVKADEVEWSGLREFLSLQGDAKVTKDAVLDYLQQSGVRVEEVMKGGDEATRALDDARVRLDAMGYTLHDEAMGLRLVRRSDGAEFQADGDAEFETADGEFLEPRAAEWARVAFNVVNNDYDSDELTDSDTRYSQYTLPGGSNYKELLLTLPVKLGEMPEIRVEPRGDYPGSPGGFNAYRGGEFIGWGNTPEEARQFAIDNWRHEQTKKAQKYTSSHWSESNIIAHIRMNDRTDADGRKTLFIEEIQSDFAQQGRRERTNRVKTMMKLRGITQDEAEKLVPKDAGFYDPAKPWQLFDSRTGEVRGNFATEAEAKAAGAASSMGSWDYEDMRHAKDAAPRAPFVTNTDAWLSLALKRIVKYAADGGFERVAFVNGQQSVDRYWGHELVAPAVRRWSEVTKPQGIREQFEDVLGRKMAALMPLDHVDAGVLPMLKHDQVRRAVVALLPVDVVNILSRSHVSAEKLLRQPDVVLEDIPVDARDAVAVGVLDAVRRAGASVRAELRRLTSGGDDIEVLPALRASQLNAREIAGVVSPGTIFHLGAGGRPHGAAAAGAPAKAPPRSNGGAGALELPAAELASLLNAHAEIVGGRNGLLQQSVQPPPGRGMLAFYDRIVPAALNKLLPKVGGGKLGEVRIAKTEKKVDIDWSALREDAKELSQGNIDYDEFRSNHGLTPELAPDIELEALVNRDPYRSNAAVISGFISTLKQRVAAGKAMKQPGFDVTDSMRKAAEGGLPLFAQGFNTRQIQVDGKWRPIDAANGRMLHPTFQGQSEFWRRFGNRFPLDEQGRPRVEQDEVQRLLDTAGVVPMFSQDMPLNDPRSFREIKDAAMAEFLTGSSTGKGTIHWWHKTLGTQYNLAERYPAFKRVYDRVQTFLEDVSFYATEAANKAPTILPKLDTWIDLLPKALGGSGKGPLSPQDNVAIRAPIIDGTLRYTRDKFGNPIEIDAMREQAKTMTADEKGEQMVRNRQLAQSVLTMWKGLPYEQFSAMVESRFESVALRPGIVWTDTELRSRYELTDGQIKLYREFRSATDESITRLALSGMVRLAGKDADFIRDEVMAAASVKEGMDLLKQQLQQTAQEQLDRAAGLSKTADKIEEAARKAQLLMDEGYAPLMRFGHFTLAMYGPNEETGEQELKFFSMYESRLDARVAEQRLRAAHDGEAVRFERGTVNEEAYKLFAGINPDTAELFGEMLGLDATGDEASDLAFQSFLRLAKSNRSAMKRMIHRKGTAGFSEDMPRVLAALVYSNARMTSRTLHAKEMTEAVNDIDKRQGELQRQATRLVEYVNNPGEEAHALRSLLFAQYLGGSIAAALVNMTQPMAVTTPYLSQWGGPRKAAERVAAAAKVAFLKGVGKEVSTGSPELDRALNKAEEEGIVAPQEIHSLMAQASGTGGLRAGDGTRLGNIAATGMNFGSRLMAAWGKPFATAELFNRRATFIAAYRTAKEEGIADAFDFAKKAVDETQFVYNKGARPQWARGAIGATLLTFKTYSLSYLELIARLWTAGEPGSPERAAGRRAVYFAAAMMLLLGGAGGFPFAEDVEDLVDGLMQRLGYNWQTKQKLREMLQAAFGKPIGSFLEKGLSGIPGMPLDVSMRLGMGNLIPGTGLLQKKRDHTRDVLEIAGPTGDMGRRALAAADLLSEGEVTGAMREGMPKALRDVAQATEMWVTGEYRDTKGRKVIDVTGTDALMKGIGFNPGAVAKASEGDRAAQAMVDVARLREGEIAAKWAKGIVDGDQALQQEARRELADWNERNAATPIKIRLQDVLRRARKMRQSRSERIEASAPREVRQEARRMMRE